MCKIGKRGRKSAFGKAFHGSLEAGAIEHAGRQHRRLAADCEHCDQSVGIFPWHQVREEYTMLRVCSNSKFASTPRVCAPCTPTRIRRRACLDGRATAGRRVQNGPPSRMRSRDLPGTGRGTRRACTSRGQQRGGRRGRRRAARGLRTGRRAWVLGIVKRQGRRGRRRRLGAARADGAGGQSYLITGPAARPNVRGTFHGPVSLRRAAAYEGSRTDDDRG